MAGAIVNLEDIVPGLEGKTFRLPDGVDEQGEKKYRDYYVPGDLESDTVFEFLALFTKMIETQQRSNELSAEVAENPETEKAAADEVMESLKELMATIKAKLLAVFQISDPELRSLPFGSQTTMVVLGEVLEMMGLAAPVQELPTPAPRVPQDRKPKAPRKPKAQKPTTATTTTRSTTKAA